MTVAMDKLKLRFGMNQKMLYFFVVLFILGLSFGALLTILMKEQDQSMVLDYLNSFFHQVKSENLKYLPTFFQSLVSNFLFVGMIWLLGISVIGIPVMLLMYFSKAFILGFTIASMIFHFSWKGILFSFFYIFPHHIIAAVLYTLLLMYATSLSLTLIRAFTKKKTLDFRKIIYKYGMVFILCIIGSVIVSLCEVFLMPMLLNLVL